MKDMVYSENGRPDEDDEFLLHSILRLAAAEYDGRLAPEPAPVIRGDDSAESGDHEDLARLQGDRGLIVDGCGLGSLDRLLRRSRARSEIRDVHEGGQSDTELQQHRVV